MIALTESIASTDRLCDYRRSLPRWASVFPKHLRESGFSLFNSPPSDAVLMAGQI
jgi:hypothetical protein